MHHKREWGSTSKRKGGKSLGNIRKKDLLKVSNACGETNKRVVQRTGAKTWNKFWRRNINLPIKHNAVRYGNILEYLRVILIAVSRQRNQP